LAFCFQSGASPSPWLESPCRRAILSRVSTTACPGCSRPGPTRAAQESRLPPIIMRGPGFFRRTCASFRPSFSPLPLHGPSVFSGRAIFGPGVMGPQQPPSIFGFSLLASHPICLFFWGPPTLKAWRSTRRLGGIRRGRNGLGPVSWCGVPLRSASRRPTAGVDGSKSSRRLHYRPRAHRPRPARGGGKKGYCRNAPNPMRGRASKPGLMGLFWVSGSVPRVPPRAQGPIPTSAVTPRISATNTGQFSPSSTIQSPAFCSGRVVAPVFLPPLRFMASART